MSILVLLSFIKDTIEYLVCFPEKKNLKSPNWHLIFIVRISKRNGSDFVSYRAFFDLFLTFGKRRFILEKISYIEVMVQITQLLDIL